MASTPSARRPLRSYLRSHFIGHPFRLLLATGATVLWAHVITNYTYIIVPTRGASMLPTFSVLGDWALISRSHRRGRNIVVGDIVTFDSVVEPGERVIKRVIGLPGDYVLRDTPSSPSPSPSPSSSGGGGDEKMLQVPPGHCWVVGDNMSDSRDSRLFGPVPLALVRGKVVAKVLPWSERAWFENPLVKV